MLLTCYAKDQAIAAPREVHKQSKKLRLAVLNTPSQIRWKDTSLRPVDCAAARFIATGLIPAYFLNHLFQLTDAGLSPAWLEAFHLEAPFFSLKIFRIN